MDWLAQKETLLQELGAYIRLCSNATEPALDYIARLQRVKALVSTANEAEFAPYPAWWSSVRPPGLQHAPTTCNRAACS